MALRAGRRRRFWAVLVFFGRLVEASGRVYRRASPRRRKWACRQAKFRAAIMQARDLSRKGSLKRQREYAERTAGKALRQAKE